MLSTEKSAQSKTILEEGISKHVKLNDSFVTSRLNWDDKIVTFLLATFTLRVIILALLCNRFHFRLLENDCGTNSLVDQMATTALNSIFSHQKFCPAFVPEHGCWAIGDSTSAGAGAASQLRDSIMSSKSIISTLQRSACLKSILRV